MNPLGCSFIIACLAVVAINTAANHWTHGRLVDARGVAVMLLLMCSASNVQHALAPDARWLYLYPVMDLAGLITMAIVSINRPRIWMVGVGFCLLTELFAHTTALPDVIAQGEGSNVAVQYHTVLDILFALQLLFAVLPGGLNLARVVATRMSRRRLFGHGLVAGAGK